MLAHQLVSMSFIQLKNRVGFRNALSYTVNDYYMIGWILGQDGGLLRWNASKLTSNVSELHVRSQISDN